MIFFCVWEKTIMTTDAEAMINEGRMEIKNEVRMSRLISGG